jgi:hypothetical protein
MKRIGFRLGIALLTFSLGVGAAWSYLHILRPFLMAPSSTPTKEAISRPIPLTSSDSPPEAVKISLRRSYRDEYGLIRAEFEVANGGSEPLYYRGYSKDDNEYWSVRHGRRSHRWSTFCGTGLAEYQLLPGKSASFEVVIGREAGSVQVGFDFFVGEKRLRQTIWSDEITIPES